MPTSEGAEREWLAVCLGRGNRTVWRWSQGKPGSQGCKERLELDAAVLRF